MAFADILSSLLGASQMSGSSDPGFGASRGPIDPGQSTAPGGQTSMPLSELVVQGRPKQQPLPMQTSPSVMDNSLMSAPPSYSPTPPPNPGVSQSPQPDTLNRDNSQAVRNNNAALMAEGTPMGGSANPGIYGLLPKNLQHGTLRNVLGAIGDAFLVQSGHAPNYANSMARQQLGNAMVGLDINDPDSVAATTQRMAATGAPGAMEMADKIQQQAEQAALRKQYMEYNNNYREQMIGVRQDSQHAQAAGIADRYRGQIGGMLTGIKDPAIYASKYASLGPLAQQIGGPNATPASIFTIPTPEAWTPELTAGYGMTANNQQVSADKAEQRQVSMRDTDVSAQSRTGAAAIAAGGHVTAAKIAASRASESQFQDAYIAAKQAGQQTTPEQDQRYAHDTQLNGRGRRGLPSANQATNIGTGGGGAGGHVAIQGGYPVYTPDQARAAARVPGNSGKKFIIQGTPGLQVFH